MQLIVASSIYNTRRTKKRQLFVVLWLQYSFWLCMVALMNAKEQLKNDLEARGTTLTIAYINMLLAGSRHASYSTGKVIGEITDSSTDVWCDKEKFKKRKVAFSMYSDAKRVN